MPDLLAKTLVERALEFHARRPWTRVEVDAPLLVRVPDDEHPLVVTIVGQGGEHFGVSLWRGPDAFDQSVALSLASSDGREIHAAASVLMLSFDPLSEIPPEFRSVLKSAGHRARPGAAAPFLMASPPHAHTRPLNRREARIMAQCLAGLQSLDDAGALAPRSLSSQPRRMIEVRVTGEVGHETCEHAWVPTPSTSIDLPPLLSLPESLAQLERRAVDWGLHLVRIEGRVGNDERVPMAIVIADLDADKILATRVMLGDDLAQVADVLADVLNEQGARPRTLWCANTRVADALTPALSGLDLEVRVDDEAPWAKVQAESLQASLAERGQGGRDRLPTTRAGWLDVDFDVLDQLIAETSEDALGADKIARYFGPRTGLRWLEDEATQKLAGVTFSEWALGDARERSSTPTIVERALTQRQWSAAERACLESRRAAHLSLFRIDRVEPGGDVEAFDVLAERSLTIEDPNLVQIAREGSLLPLRIRRLGSFTFARIAGPPMGVLHADRALDALQRQGLELAADGLQKRPELLGRLWDILDEVEAARSATPLALSNTDGEPLAMQRATFYVADRAALTRGLASRPDVDAEEDDGQWTWFGAALTAPKRGRGKRRRAEPGSGRKVLARFELVADSLLVEVNSDGRLARARDLLETIPGVEFRSTMPVDLTSGPAPLDDRLAVPVGGAVDVAEMQEQMEEFLRQRYLTWLDEAIPVLGGKSPRMAVKTAAGRSQVKRLILTMPAVPFPGGAAQPPRAELLRELGL